MATVIDFSSAVPSAAAIRDAGHDGAVMYISPPRPDAASWMHGKDVSRAVIDDFDAHDLKAAFIWQYRKGGSIDVGDAGRGFDGGVADAKAAQEHLDEIRCSGHPVYFAVDWNITLDEWNHRVRAYFEGAASVLGTQRVGIYGHSRVCHWAGPDNQVVGQVEPGRYLCWVAGPRSWGSWDGDRKRGRDYAVLFQHPTNVPGPDGVDVDVNEVFHPEWGWRALDSYQPSPRPRDKIDPANIRLRPNPAHRGDPHFLPDVLRAFGVPVEEMPGWDTWGMGDFDRIWGVCVHHTGANNTSADFIKHNGNMAGALSSQIHQSRTPPYTVTLCGVGVAWHMGHGSYPGLPKDAANPLLIGWEPQSNGTDPWPEGMLDIYHRGVAAILWFLGYDSSRAIAHWEYSLVAQGKWDPGAGNGIPGALMDMDHFRARVQHYIDHPPFLEGINDMALDLNKRYAFRTPERYRSEGAPADGTLLDVWLNADAHAFVSRVNTEAIIQQLKEQHEERAAIDRDLAQALHDVADALRS